MTEKLDFSTDPMSFFTDLPEPGTHGIIGGRTTRGASYCVIRERGRDDWLLLQTLKGAGLVAGKGPEKTAQPGSVVLFPPNCPQRYRTEAAATKWTILWMHFAPPVHWIPWLPPQDAMDPTLLKTGSAKAFQRIENAVAGCLHHLRTGLPGGTDLAANALERALILLHQATAMAARPVIDARINKAVEWIGQNLGEPFALDEVARIVGLSPSRFGYLFRKDIGMSPQKFAESRKLDFAARLLRLTDDQVQEVARSVGYADAFYFSRRFQSRYGKSPSEYRKPPVALSIRYTDLPDSQSERDRCPMR